MIRPPSGESAMPASSARKPIPAQAKSGEKLRRIQSLIAVSAATTAGPCHRLRTTAASNTASGVKNTGRLSGCFESGRFGGAGKGSADRTGWARQHGGCPAQGQIGRNGRSEEHTSELQSLMRISYAVFCLQKKKTKKIT